MLTQIDVRATMRSRLGVEERPYRILGACHPRLAQDARGAEPGVGLLLPCNVLRVADDAGGVPVSAVDPLILFAAVRVHLERALAAL